IIGDSWAYHSAEDDADHLEPGTLQHYGDLTLALTRDLAQRDLAALTPREEESPVQTTAPWGVVQVPPGLVAALALLAPLAGLAAVLVRRRRGAVSPRGPAPGAAAGLPGLGGAPPGRVPARAVPVPVAARAAVLVRRRRGGVSPGGAAPGAAAFLLVLVGAVLGGAGLWALTAAATPEMLSQATHEPVRAELFVLAELVAAAVVAAALWVLARCLISRAAALLGASLLVTLLLAVLGVYSPDLGGAMILPAAIAAGGTLLASVLPPRAGLVALG